MQIWYAIAVLGGIGLVFGLILAGASKVFAVARDERFDDLMKTLPGANCGGCGFAGCEAYAAEVLAGNAATNLCPVGGDEVSAKLAGVMGVQLTKNTRFTALVKCSGGVRARKKFQYAGINDCVAARSIGGGLLECRYGCLGLGTCVRACQFGAISVVDGVALVDHERCTGCMRCAEVCPKGVIQAVPYYADVNVCCSSKEKGASLRKMCEIGCIGCRLCEKVCKRDAIRVEGNLAVIDHEKCDSCGDCAEKCPRKLIVDANLDRGPRLDTEELIKEA
ncbi:electron transport complex protein RnfB [Clostridia bacterium]|nr:electron transport complex protein RnfB [Clostridia bacterium]